METLSIIKSNYVVSNIASLHDSFKLFLAKM